MWNVSVFGMGRMNLNLGQLPERPSLVFYHNSEVRTKTGNLWVVRILNISDEL